MMTTAVDEPLAALAGHKDEWAGLSLAEKIRLLDGLRPRVNDVAAAWVAAAVEAKGIDPGSPLVGEEWLTGPGPVLNGVNALLHTLTLVEQGKPPLPDSKFRTRPDDQVVAEVFPSGIFDVLLLNGVHGEIWMQP